MAYQVLHLLSCTGGTPSLAGGTLGVPPPPAGVPPGWTWLRYPHVDRQTDGRTDTCRNITFPRTTYAVGNKIGKKRVPLKQLLVGASKTNPVLSSFKTRSVGYRERLTMPKMMTSGTSDQFFLPDETHNWWNDIPQPMYLRCVINFTANCLKTLKLYLNQVLKTLQPKLQTNHTSVLMPQLVNFCLLEHYISSDRSFYYPIICTILFCSLTPRQCLLI